MDQPIFWSLLGLVAMTGVVARMIARRPWWPTRAQALRPWELAVGGVSVLALVFHCAAMFFATWVDALGFLEAPAAGVRELGTGSQLAYWVPAAIVVVAARRVWPPALGVLVIALVGVGITMFWHFSLTTHLAWLGAAVTTGVVISSGLVALRTHPTAVPWH